MVNSNPGFLSTLATNPNTRIVDGTDNIHSGIINSLNIATGGNCVISGFDITQEDGGSYTRYAVATGKILRDGLLVSVSAATLSPTAGSRAGNDWYATIVVAANNTLAIRVGGKDISTASVSTLTADDIPIAIVKYVAGSADDAVNRLVQFLGYSQSDRGFSVLDNGSETIRFNANGTVTKGGATLTLPSSTGTIALTSDIEYTSPIPNATASQTGLATSTQITKLDGIEANATADQTKSDINTLYSWSTDPESGATADQTDAEIETAYNTRVAQVSSAERTAGNSTAIKRFTPADIKSMIDTHQTDTDTNDNVSVANLKTALNSDFGSDFTIGSQSNDTATFTGHLTVGGNLTVSGDTTTITSNTLAVGDNKIVLNTDVTGTPTQDSGIEVERGNATNVTLQWNEATDRWQFTNDGSTFYNLPTTAELANPYVHPDSVVANIDTSGATIVDSIATNATGHITAMGTRTLLLSDLGYTGAADANKYVHPDHSGDVTSNADGATTIAANAVTSGKIAANAVTSAKINSGAIDNSKISSTAAIAQSKISGLTSALSGKEPSLTIGDGLDRTSATLKVDILDVDIENGIDRSADFILYNDNTVGLRRINLVNIFDKLIASDIPDISSAYRATGTTLVNADISNTAAINADKIANGTTNKVFTATLKTKLDGIAAGATAGADWSSNVANISVANSQLAGSIANNKLSNSSVTINGTSLNLGGTLTLDTDDFAEGSNKYYTDERVDDRVNALITDGEGITTTYDDNAGTLSIAAEEATTSNKGVASFSSAHFDVTSGAVSIKAASISDSQIASNGSIAQSKIAGLVSDLAGKAGSLSDLNVTASAAEINILDGVTGVSATEIGYLDGVTSSIQTQLNSKLSSVQVSDLTGITGLTTTISSGSTHSQLPSAAAVKAYIEAQQAEDRQYTVTATTPDGGNDAHIKISSQLGDSSTLLVEGGTRITTRVNQGRLTIDSDSSGVDSAAFSQGTLTLTNDDASTVSATLPDATTDAHGLMTDDQFDKLAGIEALADVTDKANVVDALGLLNESDTLYLGDAGNDTTVRVRGNFFVDGTLTTINQTEINVQDALVFEGATGDDYETTLRIIDPTADQVISLPNITGTVITTGDSQTVATGMIANLGVTTGKIASNAVTNGKLATGAVVTAKLADDAVTGAKINFIDDSIAATDTHIMVADGTNYNNVAISGDATLANDGVLTIANLAVETAMLANLGVTTAKIAADAVTGAKIADDAIDSEHLANGSIDTIHIADDQVTYAKMQNVSATNRILGRDSSGAGIIEEIEPADVVTMLGIEANADVTDATNVAAAGALMDGDFTSNGFLKRTGAGSYTVDTNTYLTSLSVTGLSDIAAFETNFADGVSANDDSLASAKSIKAYVDSVGGAATGSTTFQLEDGDGTELTISHGKEIKFVEGGLIDINWTDVDNGTDADPWDLTFTVDPLLRNYTNTEADGSQLFATDDELTAAIASTAITGKVLTNLVTNSGGTVAATDTILAAFGKLENRVALNDAKVTNTDINVNEANLRTRLADISSNVTIGDATDVTVTTSGALVVTGNLTVNGTTTTIDTNTVNIGDNIIVLNADATGSASQDAGIEIERGDDSNKTLIWDETNDRWTVGSETLVAGTFIGPLTGDVTGNVSGNAGTATVLQTARSIAGKSFNGSADITIATTDLSDISALDTDLSDVSANHDSLATAKAIKAYVDAQILTEDTIAELNDTTIGTLSAGELLIYNATSGKWVNADLTAGTNVSITDADGAITIASTDTTYSAGQGMALSGTTFSVANPSSLDTMTEDGASSTLTAAGADNIMVYDGSGTTWAKMSLAEVADFAISNGAGGISTFKTISVSGQDNIVADATADTLTLTAGSGITIANTAASDTITFSVANGDISNAMLANDSVSFGGVSVDLGQTDATPAFDLTDATNYPTSSLTGTITNAQLSNSSITVSDGSNSTATALGGTITFAGTANEVEVAESSGTITVGLPSNVTLGGDLNVNGGDIVVGTGNNSAGIFTAGTGQLLLGNDYDSDDGNEAMIGIRGDGGVSRVVGISNTLQLMTDRNTDDIVFTTGTNTSNDGNTTDHVRINGGTRTTHFYGANYDTTIVDGKISLGAIGNVSGESSSILSVNSLGAVKINLDTNSNDTGSYFRVTEGGSGDIFNIDYAGNATVYGDLTVTGNDIKSSSGDTVITLSNDDATFADNVTVTDTLYVSDSHLRDDGANLKVVGNTQTQYQVQGQYGGHIFYTQDGSGSAPNNYTEVFKVNYLGNIELGSNRDTTIAMSATAHDTAGKDLTISAGDTTAGTTNNIAGGDLYLQGGQGKGTGAGGNIYFQTADGGSSGSTLNSLATAFTVFDNGNATFANDLTVTGTLTVNGGTTTVNSNEVNIGDSIIKLNADHTGAVADVDAGLEIHRGDDANKFFFWDEGNDRWTVGSETMVAGNFTSEIFGASADNRITVSESNDRITFRTNGGDRLVIYNNGVSTFTGAINVDNINLDGNTISSTNTNGDITITPNGTGDIVLDSQKWPQADGSAGQILKTDGSGQLSWVAGSTVGGDGLSYNGSTANGLLTYGGASTIDVESSLTYDPSGMLKITSTGFGRHEIQGNSGAYIDLKNSDAEDFDVRFITDGTGLDITTLGGSSPIALRTNNAQRMKIEDAQTTLSHHLSFGTTSNPYIKAGTGGPLAIRGDEDGLATSYSNNTPTYSTAASIQLRVNASNQTAMEIQNNKDIKTYGFLKSGTNGDIYGANTFAMGTTGTNIANDWFEVFRWTPKTDGGSDANNWQYDNFSAKFTVTARGIGRSSFDIYVRGEYGVQDSNGWWTKEFIIDGWDDNVADSDTTFRMVYNAGTGGSTPYASLYQKRDEDWELRHIKLVQCHTNCYFDYFNTNVGETDPTHDTNTGSANLDPSIRRKLYVDANEQLINGVSATGIYFDDTNDRLGVGMSTPQHNLDIWGSDASIRLVDTSDSDNSAKIVVGEDSSVTVASEASVEFGWEMHYNSSGNDFFELKMMDATNGDVANALVVDRFGKVGIGTDSPAGNLHISSGTSGDATVIIEADTDNNAEGDTPKLWFKADGGINEGAIILNDNELDIVSNVASSGGIRFLTGTTSNTGTTSPLTNATERMKIASDGTVTVAGAFSAATKSFDIEHPTEEGKRLHHGSLEGPEHGVYIRGRLEGDTIELPDYWLGLVDEDTITVQLTPNKGFQQIYVDHIEDNKVYVGTQTDTPIDCFYFIQAERKDVDKMEVEYDAVV